MIKALAASPSPDSVRFYCSSGGNAGLACAHTAVMLGRPATVVLSHAASPLMRAKLLALGVDVRQEGENWAQADAYLREALLAGDPTGVYVPPFDHPHIWDGAATIVDELREQLGAGEEIDAIVCSVGGGGMLNGIMQGVDAHTWSGDRKPRVLAVETVGADSLNASVRAGEHVTLPAITSIASSLGATRVSVRSWEYARDSAHLRSITVSDADAAASCVRFADDARLLVETACGATLAVVYAGRLRAELSAMKTGGGDGDSDKEWAGKNVILEVCGGSGISLEVLEMYRERYAAQASFKLS